jgi:hypothetical protein
MLGPRRFWRRVVAQEVGKVLSDLVIDNFEKYLRHRN